MANITPTAGAAIPNPSHHATLTDGTTTVGLILQNPGSISSNPHPRTATQYQQGQNEFSNLTLPFRERVQSDSSGGRAQYDLEDDESRYYDAWSVLTHHEKKVFLGGQAEWADDQLRTTVGYGPLPQGDVHMVNMVGAHQVIATPSGAAGTVTAVRYLFWVERVGTPAYDLWAAMINASGAAPGTSYVADTNAILTATDCEIGVGRWVMVTCTGSASGAAPYIGLLTSNTADTANCWRVALIKSDTAGFHTTALGAAWVAGERAYIRVFNTTEEVPGLWFTYRGLPYFVTQPANGGASSVWENGDRGIATGGSTTTLVDSDQAWAVNFWSARDGYVVFQTGAASKMRNNWAKIVSNTSNTLTFAAVDVAPAAGVEYVIVGTTYFHEVVSTATMVYYVTDAEECDSFVAFARGEDAGVRLMYLLQVGTDWTYVLGNTCPNATKLKAIRNGNGEMWLWGSRDYKLPWGTSVWGGPVPEVIGDNTVDNIVVKRLGELVPAYIPWQGRYYTNVTNALSTLYGPSIVIAAGFTTGHAACYNLATPIDISGAQYLEMRIHSSVATAAGDVELVLSDVQGLGQSYIPSHMIHYAQFAPPALVFYNDVAPSNVFYPSSNSTVIDTDYRMSMPAWVTGDYVYLSHTERFSHIDNVLSTVNTAVQTSVVQYWDGQAWTAVSHTDGTLLAGATFGQSGAIYWTIPRDWEKGSGSSTDSLNESYYWVRLHPTGTLTAIEWQDVYLRSTDWDRGVVEYWENLVRPRNADKNTYEKITLTSNGNLYIGCQERFNKITVDMGTTVNAIASVMSATYGNGYDFVAVSGFSDGTASSGKTLAQDGSITFTMPRDFGMMTIEGSEAYWVKLAFTVNLTVDIDIAEVALSTNTNIYLDVPAMEAATWHRFNLGYTILPFDGENEPDPKLIRSVGINIATDNGAQTITLAGGIVMSRSEPERITLCSWNETIKNIGAWGDERRNPMVVTDAGVYEIQTENDNSVVPIPLDEIKMLRSLRNGLAVGTTDAYFLFNLGPRLQRYVSGTLDNLGPTNDEGLPEDRQGDIVAIQSAPGQVFFAIDADTNYSSVMLYDNSGFHPVYIAPKGERIWSMSLQALPYEKDVLRLWIAQGGDILYIPIAISRPDRCNSFRFEHQGNLVTSWISGGNVKVEKLFRSLRLHTENLSATHQEIRCQYQIDSGELASGWTDLNTYDTSPYEDAYISVVGANVDGLMIRFRFIFETDDNEITPILNAYVLEMIWRLQPRSLWTLQIIAADRMDNMTGQIDETARAEDLIDQLNLWAQAPATLLTLRSPYSVWDSKTVVCEPFPMSPKAPLIPGDAQTAIEGLLCEINLTEV